MPGAASASVPRLDPHGGLPTQIGRGVRKKVGGVNRPEGCRKIHGHTGDVARRAEAGVGFLGRGSTAGPLPISYEVWGELSPSPPKKKSRICTNPVAMPVDGRGRTPLCPPWLRYCETIQSGPKTGPFVTLLYNSCI